MKSYRMSRIVTQLDQFEFIDMSRIVTLKTPIYSLKNIKITNIID
ncbi:hypothetical protein [Candidatus Sulfurimonas marisnigri]|nr:hypothetical protein [Candidatus Sulfurimonas marisnigri]